MHYDKPTEWVWNNVKNDRIGRSVIMSADDLKAKAIGALRRLQKLPDIVRGFLRDPKLAYILELHKRTTCEVYKLIFSLVGTSSPHRRPEQRCLPQGSLGLLVLRRSVELTGLYGGKEARSTGTYRSDPPAHRSTRDYLRSGITFT
jgi:hypothetical protein